ncbi:MAG: NAD(P)H-dependent oxidoreductase [Promicromonosporaceae bacterium]|nr:NAD(P)H-dependent oxidoreductase [Promicromonosporaceae bacterium]
MRSLRPAPVRSDVVVLVGNPRPASRTRAAAEAVAAQVARHRQIDGDAVTIELADLAGDLFAPDAPAVDAALAQAASARLLVVATPVYKGSYTGLLKAFLDRYGPGGLDGVPVVPLVVSASPAHSAAGDVHLLPLLAELGADVPASALALLEPDLPDAAAAADRWVDAVRTAAVRATAEVAS